MSLISQIKNGESKILEFKEKMPGSDNIAGTAELERQRLNRSFDEEVNYEVALEELNLLPLHKQFSAKGRTLKTEQLLNFKLVSEENRILRPTNGLLILLGHPSQVATKCSRFKGKNMDVFLDKKEYTDDLFSQLENAMTFILNHIHIRAEINGLKRTEITEIPLAAIREALINALVHRDYANPGRDIKLGIYDDMLNIVSPGGLPSSLTEETILEGRSEIRNKVIARVFKELDYIEQWGSGIRRIISACASAGLTPPVFREKGDFFDVEIFRTLANNTGSVPDNAGSVPDQCRIMPDSAESTKTASAPEFSQQENQVLQLLKTRESLSTADLAIHLGVKQRRARAILQKMVSHNILHKIGSARNTRYTLPSTPPPA